MDGAGTRSHAPGRRMASSKAVATTRSRGTAGPDGDDVIAVRTCAYFSLSFDHRIVDGADADRFLADVKKGLENFPDNGV